MVSPAHLEDALIECSLNVKPGGVGVVGTNRGARRPQTHETKRPRTTTTAPQMKEVKRSSYPHSCERGAASQAGGISLLTQVAIRLSDAGALQSVAQLHEQDNVALRQATSAPRPVGPGLIALITDPLSENHLAFARR